MRVEFGAEVYSSDGHLVGTVDQVILDPATDGVRTIAIRQGRWLPHDIEVPLTALQVVPDGSLQLKATADEARRFPRFVESLYTTEPPAYRSAAGLAGGGTFLPAGYVYPVDWSMPEPLAASEVQEQLAVMFTEQDLANAVVGEGSLVRGRDGHPVGKLHELSFDERTGHLTRFAMRRGDDVMLSLPASLIARVDDGVIDLTASAGWVDLWAGLTPGVEVWTSDRVCLGTISQRATDHLVVLSPDGREEVRVPLTAVGRLSQNRLLLTADRARTVLWAVPAAH